MLGGRDGSKSLGAMPPLWRQATIEKLLPLASMEPGQYTLKLKVTDNLAKTVLTPSATFTVK